MTRAKKRAIDFSQAGDGSNFRPKRKPAGDYRAVILEVVEQESKEGNEMWVYTLSPVSDKSATYPYYCVLNPENAWKLRNLFIAAGVDVPKKRLNVDPNRVIDEEVGITLADDEYNEREKSTIDQVFSADDLNGDSPEDEEKPARRTRAATSANSHRRKPAPVDDEDDDDDDEEEERPARRTRRTTAASKRTAKTTSSSRRSNRRAPVDEDDVTDEETEELDLDEL